MITKRKIPVRHHKRQLQSGQITSVKRHSRMIEQKPIRLKVEKILHKKGQFRQQERSIETLTPVKRVRKIKVKPSNIYNEKTKQRFREIADNYDKYPRSFVEYGFGIDKNGKTSDIIIGEPAKVKAGMESYKKFGEDLEFIVHTHSDLFQEGDMKISRFFSMEDLLTSETYKAIPVLFYREEIWEEPSKTASVKVKERKLQYSIKSLTNIPKDRALIVRDYGKIQEEFRIAESNWMNKWNLKNSWDYIDLPKDKFKTAEIEMDEIRKNSINQYKKIEKEYGIIEKKLFKRKYPKALQTYYV